MTTRTVPKPAPAEVPSTGRTLVVVPDAHLDASRSWRRLIQAINPAEKGAFALDGPNLSPGVAYEVSDGALIVAVDKLSDGFLVRLLRVTEHELAEEKAWELKNALGKRVVDYIQRRLAPTADRHRAARAETIPNQWSARCAECGRTVRPGEGIVLPRPFGMPGTATVTHRPGACPPPPEVISPNRRSEPCLVCGRWVPAGTGVARRRTQPDEHSGSWYQACHDGECPPDAPIGPVNRRAGWCTDCGELVQPGQGWRDPGEEGWPLRHLEGTCLPPKPYPTWIVRRSRHEPAMEVGQVRRVRVDLRGGTGEGWGGLLSWAVWRRPDNKPVPPAVPGFRVLREDYVEMVAVVLETVGEGRRQRARVRAATPEEASELLLSEMRQAAETPLPHTEVGFKADWSAERIGDCRPWLAEIVGRHPDFGYERVFPPFRADYSRSNSRGTRGVWYHWTLTPGRVYEVDYPVTRHTGRREFLRATPDGDVVTITREEVEAWLNTAAAWIAR